MRRVFLGIRGRVWSRFPRLRIQGLLRVHRHLRLVLVLLMGRERVGRREAGREILGAWGRRCHYGLLAGVERSERFFYGGVLMIPLLRFFSCVPMCRPNKVFKASRTCGRIIGRTSNMVVVCEMQCMKPKLKASVPGQGSAWETEDERMSPTSTQCMGDPTCTSS